MRAFGANSFIDGNRAVMRSQNHLLNVVPFYC
jgi:hypothetical protein